MTGPSSLIRKSAFEIVGGYDKDIYLNCDLHWFYRLAAYFPVAFVDYVGVRKRVHALNNTAVTPHYEYGLRELETGQKILSPRVVLREKGRTGQSASRIQAGDAAHKMEPSIFLGILPVEHGAFA